MKPTPEQWQRIYQLFDEVVGLSSHERAAKLSQTSDDAVRHEVAALLVANDEAVADTAFLNAPALEVAAQAIAEEKAMTMSGREISHYKILSLLGRGGMGEVFLAQDTKLGRHVALKLLPPEFTRDSERVQRFRQEARAASALNHPNIITIFAIDEADGLQFIATEFIDGTTLRERLSEAQLNLSEALDITVQIANALAEAHAAGIIHRDIKPENVMLRPDGYVKVLDFGLARLMQRDERRGMKDESEKGNLIHPSSLRPHPSSIIGTPRYMSPEQARGETLDARTDVWSLGGTLYEMLTGKSLWEGSSTAQIVQSLNSAEPLSLQLREEHQHLQPILRKALAKDLSERYKSAQAFRADLERATHPRKISRWWMAAAALLLLAIATVSLWKTASVAPSEKLYWELSEAEKTLFVAAAAQNIASQLGENPAPLAPAHIANIQSHVERYVAKRNSLATTPGQESIKTVYARASVYAPFIIEEFRAHNLPPTLGLYIAMNETEYHPCTESAVGAKGLFSFMPTTAQRYGLQLKPRDERCDPRKIANAAAQYLSDLLPLFGRDADGMMLAMAAYNCGENCVAQAIADARKRNVSRVNIWALLGHNSSRTNPFGEETQNYVPRFLAAAILGEYPRRFGLEIQPLSTYAH